MWPTKDDKVNVMFRNIIGEVPFSHAFIEHIYKGIYLENIYNKPFGNT